MANPQIFLKLGDYDVLATRLNPYCGRQDRFRPIPLKPGQIKPVTLRGAFQGIIFCWMTIQKESGESVQVPCLCIAPDSLHTDRCWQWVRYAKARYNRAFRVWQAPIAVKDSLSRLFRAWDLIEEALTVVDWSGSAIELHWQVAIEGEDLEILQEKIDNWNSGSA